VNSLWPPALQGALVICWSSGFIGAVLASQTTSVFLVLFWRFVLASILLAPFLIPFIRRSTLPAVALQACVGPFAMFGYLATGVKAIDVGVPAGTAALIASLQPLATAAMARLLLNEAISTGQWIGLGLGLLGVGIAVGGGLGAASSFGFALSFASMLSIVVATLMAKQAALSLPLMPTLAVHSLTTAILFFPLAMAEGSVMPEMSIRFWASVLWFVVFSTIGGYGFYWLCLRRMTATRVASLIYLTPPVTMIWAWSMFGEEIRLTAIVGLCICVSGVMLVSYWQQGS